MRKTLLSLLAALFVIPTGCAHHTNPGEQLFENAKSFNEHVRWKRFQMASKFLPAEQRDRWLVGMQAAGETLQIVDYRMAPVRVGAKVSVVDVYLASYRVNNPVIERQRRRQWWTFADGNWQLKADKRLPMGSEVKPRPIPDIGPKPGEFGQVGSESRSVR